MEEENYIKEKDLVNQPKGISFKEMNILGKLLMTHICKIYCKDGSHGTGFFCNIPFSWGNILTALLTNNHVLNSDDIQPDKTITFSLNNDEKFFNILIDNKRRTYTDKNFDVTIIEIKEDDKIKDDSFFDLDKQIFLENVKDIFRGCQIYLLHYPKGIEMESSPGVIKKISEDDKTIYHLCDTSGGSSGSPIINKTNFQVIGIHKGASEGSKNYNLGSLLKEPIEKFNQEIKMSKIKFIKEKEKKINIAEKNGINNEEKEKPEINTENNEDKKNFEEKKELIENNTDENINEIIIRYKIDNIKYSKDIVIFGYKFVEKNKNICKMILNGNEFDLRDNINVNIKQLKDNNILEIKLKGIQNITDMSYIFNECELLSSLSDFSKWNTKNVTNMRCMFCNCTLTSLPDISKWNTQNVTDMSGLFRSCKSLLALPDISKWNTQNVTDMSCMFDECKSLLALPDISKWNTQKVTDMKYILRRCKSLSSLPDISKWDTQNVTNMSFMFWECESLLSLSDISNWNIQNVTDISNIFGWCKSLPSLPDISKWNIQNVTNMSYMFCGCSSLSFLPDISKWNTQNITNISCIFCGCSSLSLLPDISKWNIQKVTDISCIFQDCSSLSILPDISKWNTRNVKKISFIFGGCKSLSSLPNIDYWNVQNVTDMSHIFDGCCNLGELPDIRVWNTENATNMSAMFSNCGIYILPDISLWNTQNVTDMSYMFQNFFGDYLPDISIWNTQNVTNMSFMFCYCRYLKYLPDISNWNTQNLEDISDIFRGCKSLSSLPDICKWNAQNITNTENMFCECPSLSSFPDISIWNSKDLNRMDCKNSKSKSLLSLSNISNDISNDINKDYDNKNQDIDNFIIINNYFDGENKEKKGNVKIIKKGYIKKKNKWFLYEKRIIILDSSPKIILKAINDDNYYREISLNKKCKIILYEKNCFDLKTPDKTHRFKEIESNGNTWSDLIKNTINTYCTE